MMISHYVTEDEFARDCHKAWNKVLKRNMTQQELDYAWCVFQDDVLSKYHNMTYERLHANIEASINGKINIKSRTWFSWILSVTYKNFNLGSVKSSNEEEGD